MLISKRNAFYTNHGGFYHMEVFSRYSEGTIKFEKIGQMKWYYKVPSWAEWLDNKRVV